MNELHPPLSQPQLIDIECERVCMFPTLSYLKVKPSSPRRVDVCVVGVAEQVPQASCLLHADAEHTIPAILYQLHVDLQIMSNREAYEAKLAEVGSFADQLCDEKDIAKNLDLSSRFKNGPIGTNSDDIQTFVVHPKHLTTFLSNTTCNLLVYIGHQHHLQRLKNVVGTLRGCDCKAVMLFACNSNEEVEQVATVTASSTTTSSTTHQDGPSAALGFSDVIPPSRVYCGELTRFLFLYFTLKLTDLNQFGFNGSPTVRFGSPADWDDDHWAENLQKLWGVAMKWYHNSRTVSEEDRPQQATGVWKLIDVRVVNMAQTAEGVARERGREKKINHVRRGQRRDQVQPVYEPHVPPADIYNGYNPTFHGRGGSTYPSSWPRGVNTTSTQMAERLKILEAIKMNQMEGDQQPVQIPYEYMPPISPSETLSIYNPIHHNRPDGKKNSSLWSDRRSTERLNELQMKLREEVKKYKKCGKKGICPPE